MASDCEHFAAIVDVETTGFSPGIDEIIELGLIVFSFDPDSAEILEIIDSYSGMREPSVGIHPCAAKVHGLSLEMLRGRELDRECISDLLRKVEFVIAHNASFDRSFVIRLLPEAEEKPWLCSMREIDWTTCGCSGRSLAALRDHFCLSSSQQHRASADAMLTLDLLSLENETEGRPFFAQLLERLPEKLPEVPSPRRISPMPIRGTLANRYRRRSLTPAISIRISAEGLVIDSGIDARDFVRPTEEFIELLQAIVADDVVDPGEFRALDQWIMNNEDLITEYPFNVVANSLKAILADGRIESEELGDLRDRIREILHPASVATRNLEVEEIPLTQPPPNIKFLGKSFVFTGGFVFGEKSACEALTMAQGGICKNSVTRKTDYVVVGSKGSSDWVYGHYGTKIEKTIMNIRDGCCTAIVSEDNWAKAISVQSEGASKLPS